jgi:hypothetical protein
MSERKYRQRGYMDDDRRDRPSPGPPQPREHPRDRVGPRTYNMPGFRQVVRCARCGNLLSADVAGDASCSRCGVALHACVQCIHFDTSQRFECHQTISARVSPKDARNTCALFEIKRQMERETTTPVAPSGAKKAFDDLFKF